MDLTSLHKLYFSCSIRTAQRKTKKRIISYVEHLSSDPKISVEMPECVYRSRMDNSVPFLTLVSHAGDWVMLTFYLLGSTAMTYLKSPSKMLESKRVYFGILLQGLYSVFHFSYPCSSPYQNIRLHYSLLLSCFPIAPLVTDHCFLPFSRCLHPKQRN